MNTLEQQLVHEMHDHEQLRGRMRRVLNEYAALLGTAGLALQRGKVEVTAERIDYVLGEMHKELAKL